MSIIHLYTRIPILQNWCRSRCSPPNALQKILPKTKFSPETNASRQNALYQNASQKKNAPPKNALQEKMLPVKMLSIKMLPEKNAP